MEKRKKLVKFFCISIIFVFLFFYFISKNEYGEVYGKCKLCREPCGMLVYITKEGNCYHSERSCSGLKRTVRQVAMSQVQGRACCIRCSERKS